MGRLTLNFEKFLLDADGRPPALPDNEELNAALVKNVNRADVVPAGAVASPPDISMDSGKLEKASGVAMTPLAAMLPLSLL